MLVYPAAARGWRVAVLAALHSWVCRLQPLQCQSKPRASPTGPKHLSCISETGLYFNFNFFDLISRTVKSIYLYSHLLISSQDSTLDFIKQGGLGTVPSKSLVAIVPLGPVFGYCCIPGHTIQQTNSRKTLSQTWCRMTNLPSTNKQLRLVPWHMDQYLPKKRSEGAIGIELKSHTTSDPFPRPALKEKMPQAEAMIGCSIPSLVCQHGKTYARTASSRLNPYQQGIINHTSKSFQINF